HRAPQAQPGRRVPAADRPLTSGGGGVTARTATNTRPTTTIERNTPMRGALDTWLIFRRSVILTLRQPTWLLFGIMYPVLYLVLFGPLLDQAVGAAGGGVSATNWFVPGLLVQVADRKSTRLNSSHVAISYAVFCLKKKNK